MNTESSSPESGWIKLSELPLSISALTLIPPIETIVVDLISDCGAAAEIVARVGFHVVGFHVALLPHAEGRLHGKPSGSVLSSDI